MGLRRITQHENSERSELSISGAQTRHFHGSNSVAPLYMVGQLAACSRRRCALSLIS
jgi:hypothetical protein